MHSKKHQEIERVFNKLAKEQESAWALFSLLNHFTELLWDHYESFFLDRLRERDSSSPKSDSINLPF